MPVRLSPYERRQLEWLQQNEGDDPQGASMFFDILGGAQDRFATQKSTRQQGLQGLREMALQLAASGASEQAVTGALTGQASSLPLMGPRYGGEERIEGLESFVGGLYGEGPVSGLAPLDMREPVSGVIDDDDRAAIAGQVTELMGSGANFSDIREMIRKGFIAQGYDEFSTSEAEQEAQSVYERLIGTSLSEMQQTGMDLREMIGTSAFEPENFAHQTGIEESLLTPYQNQTTMKGFMAQAAQDPDLYRQLRELDTSFEPPSLFESTIGGLFGPNSGMPFGT